MSRMTQVNSRWPSRKNSVTVKSAGKSVPVFRRHFTSRPIPLDEIASACNGPSIVLPSICSCNSGIRRDTRCPTSSFSGYPNNRSVDWFMDVTLTNFIDRQDCSIDTIQNRTKQSRCPFTLGKIRNREERRVGSVSFDGCGHNVQWNGPSIASQS